MKEDTELLRDYADAGNDAAFRELVQRHVALVYSSALRQLNGDAHLAADVTQMVFTDLARKAGALVSHRVLAGWLFTSTRFAVSKLVRSEQRRREREKEAQLMQELTNDPDASLDWSRVRPVLDSVLADLSAADREAILLRYFERLDYREIGVRLKVADNTARMRVDRALDTLRAALARRGVTSTGAALATLLATEAVAVVPPGLAATVAGTALASGGVVSWWATFMSMTKLQMGITGVLAVAGAAGFVAQARTSATLRDEVTELQTRTAAVADARAENLRLRRTDSEVSALRAESADFARLGDEAAELKSRLRTVTRRQVAAAAADDATYDVSNLDRLPQPRVQKAPLYPIELKQAGIEGSVTVEFIVDSNGDVQNATAVKSTRVEFEPAAIKAVSGWKFEAGMKGGRAVNTRLQVPIVFSLPKDKGTAGETVPVPAAPSAPKA